MRILIATDAFPPTCGGSGWSTFELAKGLRARGHDLIILRPRFDSAETGVRDGEEYAGFRPIEFHAWAPKVPFVRNYFKNERLYCSLERVLSGLIRRNAVDIVHAQHVLTCPPSVTAARREGIPVVCTIRDYWPVCYWSDLIHDRTADTLCPECSTTMMTTCVRPHAGSTWPLALPFIPYMRANLSRKRRTLAGADAIVAVSGAVANDLRVRAAEVEGSRIETIPNPVDVASIRESAAAERPLPDPYALYVGKLEPNKGVVKLLVAMERSRLDWPLVIVRDGSERPKLEASFGASGRDVRFIGWRPREEVLRWMRHASLLIFTSHGPETLSRVLLEASALEVPIAAMDTGGTAEIVVHGETGLLSRSVESLADDVARLRSDEALRRRLGEAARRRTERLFDTRVILDRIEALYGVLIESRR